MKLKKIKKKIKHFFEYILLVVLSSFVRLFPLKTSLKSAEFLGNLFYKLNEKHKLRALENLKYAFPEKSDSELDLIIRRMYVNMVKVYLEFMNLDRINDSYLNEKITIIGKENLDNALKKGRGIVAVTGHLDNWELLGTILVKSGYKLAALYHPMRNPWSDRFFYKLRAKTGMELISMYEYLKPSLSALNENKILGLISDQDAGGDGVFVKFFNRYASTSKGPAVFAVKKKSPMLFFNLIRGENDTHTLYISEELPVKITGDLQNDIYYNTKLWSDMLEKWVRKYPEQWFWVHRRWQTKYKK